MLFEQPTTTKQLAEAPGPAAEGDHPQLQGARGGRGRARGVHLTDQSHYGEVLLEDLPPKNLLGAQLLPASVVEYSAEKVLKLAKGLEADPLLGDRVHALLGAVPLYTPNCPRKRAR
jgi:hypothetical protein